MKTLTTDGGWRNHPAVKMWRGHEHTLLRYQWDICDEWTRRGYKDTCKVKTCIVYLDAVEDGVITSDARPPWLGDEALHLSHRSRLLQKAPEHYAQFFSEDTPRDLEYVWPV